ncbi:alpha/beta fold hydrolase [Microbacterium sp. 4R-513]|uniref:lipase family protein n=1 Tax=Microbacterium sp. 4R-513 TaxID=2567934 RepID=UPI0013E10E25|nr:lipase family protein [Microbacterium sp. 4R-513]QIG38172.1 alpha/beta fold hydrolase [Microbacterium sp. 4R-513]
MSESARAGRRWLRWSVLPRVLAGAPAQLLLVVGVLIVTLALLIVARPLTSLLLLGLYVGVSAIVSGVIELGTRHPSPSWWTRVVSVLWIALGLAVIVWLGRSLELLPVALAVLLVAGGLASIGDAISGGRASQRVLSACWGVAQVGFGILALTWPVVTVLVVAVVFGIRMLVFGGSLVVRGVRMLAGRRSELDGGIAAEPSRRARAWAAAGRYALAVLLIATTAVGWWVDDWLERGAPVVDAFYDPPAEVPRGHGELIRVAGYPGQSPAGGEVKRILYTTRDAIGRPAVASALVIVPTRPHSGPRRVVSWNHGTTGVARGCAPSLRDDAATKWAIPALEDALARGWVVVASDYAGQGAPGVFPYLIGAGEAKSSLDAVLAASRIDGLWLSREIVVWGHSQGGHAALWAEPVAADYAPTLRIRGTAVLSPVTDTAALADELTKGDTNALLSVVIAWVLVPYADTYPEIDLGDYVAPGGRLIVRELTQRCPSEPGALVSVVAALGVSETTPLYTGDLTAGPFGRRLAQNEAKGPWQAPVLLTWGTADEVIPPDLQEDFVEKACAQGTRLRWVVMQGSDHLGVLLPPSRFLPTLVRWTDARFTDADDPVDDCGR